MPNLSALPERLPGCLPGCRELRSIHLRTLNKERAEILAQYWLREGRVLSPPQVGTAQVPPARFPPTLLLACGEGLPSTAQRAHSHTPW